MTCSKSPEQGSVPNESRGKAAVYFGGPMLCSSTCFVSVRGRCALLCLQNASEVSRGPATMMEATGARREICEWAQHRSMQGWGAHSEGEVAREVTKQRLGDGESGGDALARTVLSALGWKWRYPPLSDTAGPTPMTRKFRLVGAWRDGALTELRWKIRKYC